MLNNPNSSQPPSGHHFAGDQTPTTSSSDDTHTINQHPSYSRPYEFSRDSSSASFARPMSTPSLNRASANYDDLMATPEIMGLSSHGGAVGQNYSRYSSVGSRNSIGGLAALARDDDEESQFGSSSYGGRPAGPFAYGSYNRSSVGSFTQDNMARAATTDALLWDEKNAEVGFHESVRTFIHLDRSMTTFTIPTPRMNLQDMLDTANLFQEYRC